MAISLNISVEDLTTQIGKLHSLKFLLYSASLGRGAAGIPVGITPTFKDTIRIFELGQSHAIPVETLVSLLQAQVEVVKKARTYQASQMPSFKEIVDSVELTITTIDPEWWFKP